MRVPISSRHCDARSRVPVCEQLRRICGRTSEVTSVVNVRSAVELLVKLIVLPAGFVGVSFFVVRFVRDTLISRIRGWMCC